VKERRKENARSDEWVIRVGRGPLDLCAAREKFEAGYTPGVLSKECGRLFENKDMRFALAKSAKERG